MSEWKVTGPPRFVEGVGMVYPVTKGGSRFSAAEQDELEVLLAGWISVDERLPAVGQQVLIRIPVVNSFVIESARYSVEGVFVGAWCGSRGKGCGYSVTHWMPRPEEPIN